MLVSGLSLFLLPASPLPAVNRALLVGLVLFREAGGELFFPTGPALAGRPRRVTGVLDNRADGRQLWSRPYATTKNTNHFEPDGKDADQAGIGPNRQITGAGRRQP